MFYKQPEFSSHSSEVRVPTYANSDERPLLGPRLLTSPHCIFTRQKKSQLAPWPLLMRILNTFTRAPPSDLITSQRPHLLIPSQWGLGFQHTNLEGRGHRNHSVHNTLIAESPSYLQFSPCRWCTFFWLIAYSFLHSSTLSWLRSLCPSRIFDYPKPTLSFTHNSQLCPNSGCN